MKGKKFTAAEKHFQEKETKLRKEMNDWRTVAIERAEEIVELKEELRQAESTIAQQQDWIERLLQYTELSLDDIKAACKKDKAMAACADMLLGASTFMKVGSCLESSPCTFIESLYITSDR